MKKILTLAMAVLMLLPIFVSCGAKDNGVKVIDIDLTQEEYAFGIDKDQPELLAQVNAIIEKIMADGTFDKICNNYFGDGTPKAVASVPFDESKDQLVVATNLAFEPFEYLVGNDCFGIDMEVAEIIASELGLELVINNMDFDAVCLSVGQHKCDIAMSGLTVKEDRKEYVDFTNSYYNAAQKIIVKADNTEFDNCKTAADVESILKGHGSSKKAGAQNGTTGLLYLQGDEAWGFDGFELVATGYKNGSQAVQDLINGNIDYVIIDSAPAKCITDAFNEMN